MKRTNFITLFLATCSLTAFSQNCVEDKTIRKEVVNTIDTPYQAICLLSVERQRGTFQGTGFFISPRIILTAAHNIHRFSVVSFPKTITITPGASKSRPDGDSPFGKFRYTRKQVKFVTHPAFKGLKTRKSDYGIIVLPNDSIYNRIKYFFEIDVCDSVKNDIDSLLISGYPGDKTFGTQWTEGTSKFGEYRDMLVYGLATHTGLSGAPVFYKKKSDNTFHVVGIHNTGSLNGSGGCNAATKIDDDVEGRILAWGVLHAGVLED